MIQQFTDQTEQQEDRDKIWKQSLEDNLLKLANQNKADAAILELQHKEKLRLWKHGLEHKIQEIIEQHEQEREVKDLATWLRGYTRIEDTGNYEPK